MNNGDLFSAEWQQIDRIIDDNKEGARVKYLVKWKDLNYDECTWEFEDDPLMNGRNLETHVKKYMLNNDYDRACDEVQQRLDKIRQTDPGKRDLPAKPRPSLRSRRRLHGSPLVKLEDESKTPVGSPKEDKMDTDSNGVLTPTDVKMDDDVPSDAKPNNDELKKEVAPSIEGEKKAADFERLEKQPAALRGSLHDYQLEGVNWLCFSWYRKTSVILADEMGLGKTIQTIAFFVALKEVFCVRGPFLLIAPLSTIKMWEREFANWAPHLNTVIYRGKQPARKNIRDHEFFYKADNKNKEKKKDRITKFNVLVTSYEMILVDSAELKGIAWEGIAIDEAHRLKNNNSKLFQVLRGFKSQHCLLLTGTPLQNNLGELFHLLNFLMQEKFSSLEDFEKEFTDLGKSEQISKLHAMLAPHMLRRLKSDVMKEIPAKSEVIVRVDLSALQKQYYRAILTKNYDVLKRNNKKNVTSLLNVVMELKKCANHPYLFDNAEPPTKSKKEAMRLLVNASGKMLLLDRMLVKLKEQGHRVLIFSQMTRLLDILEDYMLDCGYKYERIDGTVVGDDRQARIDRFNHPASDRFVFLLSTRAGGLGINLATADTVIIYDADWNPHNDMQALSRAHRIGQTSKVMVYRLVTRASIEERIIQISKSKMMLDHLVVKKMGTRGETLLAAGELDDILRFGTEEIFTDKADAPEEKKETGEEGKGEDKQTEPASEGETTWDKTKYGDIPTSGGIYYDDAAVEKLLDRSREEEAAPTDGNLGDTSRVQNEYLNSFKVASYNVDKDGKNSEKFWERLLHDGHLKEQAELEAKLRDTMESRRSRRMVSYCEDQPFYNDDDDEWELGEIVESEDDDITDEVPENPSALANGTAKKKGSSSKLVGERSAKTKTTKSTVPHQQILTFPSKSTPVGSLPLVALSGRTLSVLGFNNVQRGAFLKLIMLYGVGDGTWSHITPHLNGTPLSRKSLPEIAAYGANLLSHLLELPNASDKFADGVPKENLNAKETLTRLATIHLVRQKVVELVTPAGPNLPPKEFDIEEAGCTDLRLTWETYRHWKRDHDKALLFAVLKHGYAKWPQIIQDPDFGLIAPILEQQKDKIPNPGLGNNAAGTTDKIDPQSNSVINTFLRKRLLLLEQALNIEHHIRVTRSLLQAQGQQLPPASASSSVTVPLTSATRAPFQRTYQPLPQAPATGVVPFSVATKPSPQAGVTTTLHHPTKPVAPFSAIASTSKFNTAQAAPSAFRPTPSAPHQNTPIVHLPTSPVVPSSASTIPTTAHPIVTPIQAPPITPVYVPPVSVPQPLHTRPETHIPTSLATTVPITPPTLPSVPIHPPRSYAPPTIPTPAFTTPPRPQVAPVPTLPSAPYLAPTPPPPSSVATPAPPVPAPLDPRIGFITKFKELYSAVHNMKEQMLTFTPSSMNEALRNDFHTIGTLALETELKLRDVP